MTAREKVSVRGICIFYILHEDVNVLVSASGCCCLSFWTHLHLTFCVLAFLSVFKVEIHIAHKLILNFYTSLVLVYDWYINIYTTMSIQLHSGRPTH